MTDVFFGTFSTSILTEIGPLVSGKAAYLPSPGHGLEDVDNRVVDVCL